MSKKIYISLVYQIAGKYFPLFHRLRRILRRFKAPYLISLRFNPVIPSEFVGGEDKILDKVNESEHMSIEP